MSNQMPAAAAIIYCEGALDGLDGKTAHGLIRRSRRYSILAVIDSCHAGRDAGEVVDGEARGIPVVDTLDAALRDERLGGPRPSHLVIGLAPIGGSLRPADRAVVVQAVRAGLHVHSGLHDFLADDPELAELAREFAVEIVDVRRPPAVEDLHGFTGKIGEVDSLRVAVLGTDSAVGKRTTSWMLVDELRRAGLSSELVATGQTAWLQGARYGTPLDSLIYDFVPGEIEHAVWTAWNEARPDVLVLEGQGGLLSPGYFGGQDLLAAAVPDLVILQHAPGRGDYDGCPGFPVDPPERHIAVIRALSPAEILGLALSREGLDSHRMDEARRSLMRRLALPVVDVFGEGVDTFVEAIRFRAKKKAGSEDPASNTREQVRD